MSKVFRICSITFIVLLGCSCLSQASSVGLLEEAKRLNLAEHPVWLKLLHYKNHRSVVLNDDFFLSPTGSVDPSAELNATIDYYLNSNLDNNSVCRFPARYFWLSKQLHLPGFTMNFDQCGRELKWSLFADIQSVSVLMVSGYWGNPASTFGHMLLRFNKQSHNFNNDLFDLTLNYGAIVPEQENPILYVAKGLVGGYEAAYSDQYFYSQDIVYTRTEFRDMWDFELNLTADQIALLILHTWEMEDKHFTYYFLKENCAYRLAEMVDLVIDEDVMAHDRPWYIPEEFFHRLVDIDVHRREYGYDGLIKNVKYIPSTQRVLYHHLNELSTEELMVFNKIVSLPLDEFKVLMEKISDDRQIVMLDALLAYQNYKSTARRGEENSDLKQLKQHILLARLSLPMQKRLELSIPELPSPVKGSPPMKWDIGYTNHDDKGEFVRLSFSPLSKDLVGMNNLEGDEIKVLNVEAAIDSDNQVALDRFDFLQVTNLTTLNLPVKDENHLSWQARIGVDRIIVNDTERYDAIVSYGAGYSKQLTDEVIFYLMVDGSMHSIKPLVQLNPQVGFRFECGQLRTWLYGGAQNAESFDQFSGVYGGTIQYQLNKNLGFFAEYDQRRASSLSIGVSRYW